MPVIVQVLQLSVYLLFLVATFFIVENALDSRQSVRDKHPIYQMEYIVKRDSDVVLTEHNKNRYSV